MYICIYTYIYIYIYILRTLRVTAVSTGDAVILEQGENQGIGGPTGSNRKRKIFTLLRGFQRVSWGPWDFSGTSEIQGVVVGR